MTTYICTRCSVDYSDYTAYIEHFRNEDGKLRFTECGRTEVVR